MNQVKLDIMRDALKRIANLQPDEALTAGVAAEIANLALADAAAVVEYRITARSWYGSNGGLYVVELLELETGRALINLAGSMWGSDAWAYDMAKAMRDRFPHIFPDRDGMAPSMYFREVCKLDYDHTEVARKKDLKP